ncbi:transposase [Corynebacterium neomassiliense]|uniref:transposase n=1 Tax=Corynebacterium neomassiliense TaxID=2079482 RepID=UPI003B02DFD9
MSQSPTRPREATPESFQPRIQLRSRPVIDTGRTVADVARELNVAPRSLGKWVAAERATDTGRTHR